MRIATVSNRNELLLYERISKISVKLINGTGNGNKTNKLHLTIKENNYNEERQN